MSCFLQLCACAHMEDVTVKMCTTEYEWDCAALYLFLSFFFKGHLNSVIQNASLSSISSSLQHSQPAAAEQMSSAAARLWHGFMSSALWNAAARRLWLLLTDMGICWSLTSPLTAWRFCHSCLNLFVGTPTNLLLITCMHRFGTLRDKHL